MIVIDPMKLLRVGFILEDVDAVWLEEDSAANGYFAIRAIVWFLKVYDAITI